LQQEIATVSSSIEELQITRVLNEFQKVSVITALNGGAHPGLECREANSNKLRDVPGLFAVMAVSVRGVETRGRLNAQAGQGFISPPIKLAIRKLDKALARAL
jgi:hypothetical protein